MIIEVECQECSEKFSVSESERKRGNGKFCSRSCGASFRNRTDPVRPCYNHEVNTKCATCATPIYRKPSLIKKYEVFYCSKVCQDNGKRVGRKRSNTYDYQKFISEIKNERGNRCQLCGWAEAAVDAHHIVQVKDGGLNIKENIIVLCPNHHRMADHKKISKEDMYKIMGRFLDSTAD